MNIAMVVGGGGFQGLPVVRALHAMGWRALVADSVAASLNRFEADIFAVVPEARHFDVFREAVLSLIEVHSVNAVFGTTMYDLPVLARLRPQLEQLGVRVFVSGLGLVELLSDKAQTMLAADGAGLATLPMIDPGQHDFSQPLIGKPKTGWGGIGVQTLENSIDWLRVSAERPPGTYIWQRKIASFREWSVDFAVRADGSCSRRVCRRRVRTTGGFAVICEIEDAPAVDDVARRTAVWLAGQGACGIFNVQFLEEPDGALWLNDINPRPGTSSTCALAAGINLVEFLLDDRCISGKCRPGTVIRTLGERFVPRLAGRIKGVVFDLDETLMSQKHWMRDKLEIVIASRQNPLEPGPLAAFRREALRLVDEGPWAQLIDLALARAGLAQEHAAALIDLWRNARPARVTLHQDASALLQALRARGTAVALLSDNPAESQRQKIAGLPADLCFAAIVLTDELAAPKPATPGFIEAARRLSLPPENLLMIGDSPWRDALGAIRSGYAGALMVRRDGAMTNPLESLFDQEFPEISDQMMWTDSLYGMDRLLDFA